MAAPKRKKKSTAVARRAPARRAPAKAKPRRTTKVVKTLSTTKVLTTLTAGSAAYGYLSGNVEAWQNFERKIPVLGNRELTTGLVLHVVNKHMIRNRYVDALAAGALAVGGYKLGESGFKLQQQGLEGDFADYDHLDVTEVAGELDPELDGV